MELSDQWWNFDSGEQNSFLSLKGDVFRPSDKPGKISLRLDIITDSVIAWSALEERIGFLLYLFDCSFSFGAFSLRLSKRFTMRFVTINIIIYLYFLNNIDFLSNLITQICEAVAVHIDIFVDLTC